MYWKQVLIVVSLSLLVGCASNPEATEAANSRRGDCIQRSTIRGYKVLDEQNLIVDAPGRKAYHVVLQRRAYGLRSSWSIGFVDSGTSRICAGFSEVVFKGQNNIGGGIRIASIKLLTPEEEEDLLIRFGLKEPEAERMPVPQDVEGADIEELDPDGGQ